MKLPPIHSLALGAAVEPRVCRLLAGRELRILVSGPRATLSLWWPTQHGAASLGEAEIDAQALRWTIAGLRRTLWELEQAEAVPERTER